MGSIHWLSVSAVVQAASAAAVAFMTFYLVRFTGRYVNEMRKANKLQEQANAISSGLLARAAREGAPFLVAAESGSSGQRGGGAKVTMTVQNRGGGLAHEITVETTWGDASLPSLGTGDNAELTFQIDTGWDPHMPPHILRFRFKDAQGTAWVQQPNQIPVEA